VLMRARDWGEEEYGKKATRKGRKKLLFRYT
jgi:hypothetical protein